MCWMAGGGQPGILNVQGLNHLQATAGLVEMRQPYLVDP